MNRNGPRKQSAPTQERAATKKRITAKTKHSAVAQALLQKIEGGVWAAGERIPSEQDIAIDHGVAYMTARQAVSSLVAEGVLERYGRRGTFVAHRPSLPSMRYRFVVLIEGDGKTSLDPYYLPPIVDAFEQIVRASGQDFIIYGFRTAVMERLLTANDLVCCVLLSESEVLLAHLLKDCGHKVFAINRCPSGSRVPFVMPDNEGGARAATEHLLRLGHRRIGFVRGLPGNIDADERLHGYLQALANFGVPPGPQEGNHFIESCGHESARKMLASDDPPTAIVCASDLSAIGAMKAAAGAGLSVPRDISIMGFGDFPVAGFLHPGLSTVRLPLAELGRTAAGEMLKLATGKEVGLPVLPCELVLRDTTAEAPLSAIRVQVI